MNERASLFDNARLRWIETWAKGWSKFISTRRIVTEEDFYLNMPLDVAVAMIEELAGVLHDPQWALNLLADDLQESGPEIGEIIEKRRYEKSANYAEAQRGN
jgi:hypothetical protein